MDNKFYIVLAVVAALAFNAVFGCSSSLPKTMTLCSHPAIMGGAPFPIKDKSYLNTNGYAKVENPSGGFIYLTGCQCVTFPENK